jgi:mRNA-degrading endonuclease RelE of RelBE toxin-antitoxin system
MTKINYRNTEEFERDWKRLLKKFSSINEDIKTAKTFAIELFHLQNINRQAIFLIPNFCSDEIKIYKLKKFACKSLKGRGVKSGIRIIYAFYVKNKTIEFIEIYFKGEKEMEDKEKIKRYLVDTKDKKREI